MNTRALVSLLPLLLACTTTPADEDEGAEDSTSGDGDGDPTGDGDGEPTEEWCGLDEGPDEPWFELYQGLDMLDLGSPLELECGFQGFFMIEINPELGGFVPASDNVNFHLILDVEGYNLGPNGHFAESDFNIWVACCDYEEPYGCYYKTTTFQIFPPDAIDDLTVLHELPAQLTVTMNNPEGPIDKSLDVQMWAMEEDMNWEFCSYGYDLDPLPVDGLPIPIPDLPRGLASQ